MKKILLTVTLAVVIAVPAVIYDADINFADEPVQPVGISADQAAAAALEFLSKNKLDWGEVKKVRHSVGVTANGLRWFAVEFERSIGGPGLILVHPETGEAEFPMPR